MPKHFRVELVAAEGRVLSREQVTFLRAPGIDGELGVLAQHTPLLTPLKNGEVLVRSDDVGEEHFFVAGGFMEVLPSKVVVLVDAAERAEEIDEARAQAAKERAEALLAESHHDAEAAAALERAIFRIKVSELRKRRQKVR